MIVGYPVLPWFGIMALGYGLSPYLTTHTKRTKFAFGIGMLLVILFVGLRSFDGYGDTQKWNWQTASVASPASSGNTVVDQVDATRTVFSFLATSKYPPSLLFVLMTLGVSMVLFGFLSTLSDSHGLIRLLKVYGSVPLFFYVLHFYLLHLGAWALYWIFKGVLVSPMHIDAVEELPAEYGFNGPGWLLQVYLGWIVVVAVLYPLCIWFRNRKRMSSSRIWSYL